MNIINDFKEVSRSCLIECERALSMESVNKEDIVIKLESFILAGSEFYGIDDSLDIAIRIAETAVMELAPDVTIPPKTSQRGRPATNIDIDVVDHLLQMNFRGKTIAKMLGVSRRTLYNKMKNNNRSVRNSYTQISREDLAHQVQTILMEVPNTGYKRMRGFLLQRSIKVPEIRVRETMRIVDPQGVFQRTAQNRAIVRRVYFVRYSNDLWHIDTNLKLVTWKIVVRGGIDGKSRVCTYLEASGNNTAESNLLAFRNAAESYGIPSRCRSDKGRENVGVARFMLENRGTGRGSHICGRSVHNQRIERFWRDVVYGCLNFYKRLFLRLEEDGILQIDNVRDLFALHYIMMPRINRHLKLFMEGWNHHPLSSEHNRTPLQILLINLPPPYYDQQCNTDMHGNGVQINEENDLMHFNEPTPITAPSTIFYELTPLQERSLASINPLEECHDYGYTLYRAARQILLV